MQMVVAIIRPHQLDAIHDALTGIGVAGMTATEVKGFGRQKGQTEVYRGAEYHINFVAKVRIDVAVPDDLVDQVVETIRATANTGKIGDGKVFVMPIGEAVRVRTGERGDEAL